MGRRFWAGALAFCLCLAGCAGAEQEPGEVSSHLLGGGSSGPEESRESEPEEGRPLSFTLQALPSEKVEAALTGDGFDYTHASPRARVLEWAGEDRLLLLTAREELLIPVEFRVFSWVPSTGETVLLAGLSDPAGNLSVQGSFVREGTPYLVFNQKYNPYLLSLTPEGVDPIPLSWLNGQPSRTGLGVWTNHPDVTLYDLLEPEGTVSQFQCQEGEQFESLSPDGDYLVFRVENKPTFAVYSRKGQRVREFSPLWLAWKWCETPGYLVYDKAGNGTTETVLADLAGGKETTLPGGEGTPFLREPAFSLLRVLEEGGAETVELLDHRTGERTALDIHPREGTQGGEPLAAYDPDTATAVILYPMSSPDGGEKWVDAYLLKLEF